MASFVDDIRYQFIARHGAVAQLIVLNVAVYLVMALLRLVAFFVGEPLGSLWALLYQQLALPADLGQLLYRPWTLVTYMFVHDLSGIFHLLFNMLWLYWMGRIFREFLGNAAVWTAYLLGALAGALLFLVLFNLIPRFPVHAAMMVGASAGVFAIVVGTATLLPEYSIPLLFFGPVRLKWLVLVLIAMDLIFLPTGNAGGHIAHLGGAMFGFAYIRLRRQGLDLTLPTERIAALGRRRQRGPKPQLRVVRGSGPSAPTQSSKSSAGDSPSQQEIDRILDKIRDVGYDKLSQEEKQRLYRASQQ